MANSEKTSTETVKGAEFWERTSSLECFSSEDRSAQYRNGHIYTICFGGLRCTEKKSGNVVGKAECEEDPVLCISIDNDLLYSAHKSKLIRAWHGSSLEPYVNFPPMKIDHKGPIILITVKGSRLVTASADSVLKVWHMEHRHCSGVLRNCSALPLCLEYAEFSELANIVICGTNSGSVHTWNADTNEMIATSAKHFSQVSDVKPLPSTKTFVSTGRDKTMIFWSWNLQPLKVIPTFEEIETIQLLPVSLASKVTNQTLDENDSYIIGSGEKAKIRVWNSKVMSEILPVGEKKDFSITKKGVLLKEQKVSHLLVCGANEEDNDDESLIIFQDDMLSLCKFKGSKNKVESMPICSNQHEILDMVMIGEKHLVAATMSPVIKIYNLADNKNMLTLASGGHSDSVLAVNVVDEHSFVSCSKDQTVCLWNIDGNGSVKLIAKGGGHSSFVGAVGSSAKLIFSASKDGILKVWKRPIEGASSADGEIKKWSLDSEVIELQTSRTLMAHEQEINSISVSLDNQFVATASQDKLCKIWRITDMGLVTALSGHRRGIWRVMFSAESVWTASADCAIKKWSLNSFQCLSTFEGHLGSVLDFIGIDEKRLASVSSDGLLKVWDLKTGTNVGNFDAHEDKIWSVTYSEATKEIITAGRDGNIFFWTDKTDEKREEERQKANEIVKTEQTLANLVHSGELDKALRYSLRLDKPRQTKKMLLKLSSLGQLETAVQKLDLDLKNILLKFVTQWNQIGGASCELAQEVLEVLLTDYLALDKDERPYKVDSRQLAGLLSYSDKHYRRLDKLQSRVAVVDLLLAQM